jgi:hypothetical protein
VSKTTTEDKVGAIQWLQDKMDDLLDSGDYKDVAPAVLIEIRQRYHRLEKEKQALLNPQPRAPRKPKKAAATVAAASAEPVAHYEPDGSYVNVNAKRGRSRT